MDSMGTYTGTNNISWRIKNPGLKDLMDGEMFEVQRALKSDFSDAKSIAVIPMNVGQNGKAEYSITDASRDIWSGNAAEQRDTMDASFSVTNPDYYLYDEDGNIRALLDVKLTSNKGTKPTIPVYYRVRRASSAVWGWVENFSHQGTLEKHNYLAPLDSIQPNYTLDPEYETNRKVHFNIHIDNREVVDVISPSKDDCQFEWRVKELYSDDSIKLHFAFEDISGTFCNGYKFCVLSPNEKDTVRGWTWLYDWRKYNESSNRYPLGSVIYFTGYYDWDTKAVYRYVMYGDCSFTSDYLSLIHI